ncbi:MAG TPA: histidinol dehydrogenase, partial [Lentisphaeria bacterium]|nr:histidinol dehydrogenase [Lentisphaeria bacterium]
YNRPACPREVEKSVAEIVANVRANGDDAVCEYLARFDKVTLSPAQFVVSAEEYAEAEQAVDETAKASIATAIAHVTAFAEQAKPHDHSFSPRPGVTLGERFIPMERVGCYIPGGTAPLVSTVIHTVAIAKAAGVREIVATTPVMKNGKVNPATLYALKQAGATEVWKLGGAYAIAALAYGTETLRKVDKIVGPGNAYVAAAKKLVYGSVAIDMVAGPSEIMIIADRSTNPAFAAADMLSQAEHGSGLEQSVIVADSKEFLDAVEAELKRQSVTLPRIATVNRVLENGTFMIEAKDMLEAAEIASGYAPEHLEVMCENPRALLPHIKAAGAIFLGQWTPEPAGDFTAGPSHVLPTAGTAKFFHGLSTADFMRRSSLLEYSEEALMKEVSAIECFASLEGLAAHGRSASIRRDSKK